MDTNRFWNAADQLVARHPVVIDRPRGSAHPRYAHVTYPLDYGYFVGTRSGDGGGVDVWIGSLAERQVTGVILTIDLHKQDAEIKLLLGCTAAEMNVVHSFHNGGEQAAMLVIRA